MGEVNATRQKQHSFRLLTSRPVIKRVEVHRKQQIEQSSEHHVRRLR
jgi:hypothetical protein